MTLHKVMSYPQSTCRPPPAQTSNLSPNMVFKRARQCSRLDILSKKLAHGRSFILIWTYGRSGEDAHPPTHDTLAPILISPSLSLHLRHRASPKTIPAPPSPKDGTTPQPASILLSCVHPLLCHQTPLARKCRIIDAQSCYIYSRIEI